jgi:NADH dehydrogenase (ubiquinone) 1 alpha subcomplex subunit 9
MNSAHTYTRAAIGGTAGGSHADNNHGYTYRIATQRTMLSSQSVSHVTRAARCVQQLSQARNVYRFPLESDINITKSGKTLISNGLGGRHSRTGYQVSVFGGSGFLGKILVSKLAKHGTITIAPYRNGRSKRHLKVNGDLGVVNFHEFDIRNLKSIEESVAHSDVVVNLLGSHLNTKNFTMADANIEGTNRIAKAAKDYGVDRFVQVSTYNADPNSPSEFFATKGIAEQVAKEHYPDATIVRPSPMYGRNSGFLNDMLTLKVLGGNILYRQEVYPTHVEQVAQALEKIVYDDSTSGKTYELYGPERYSRLELREMLKYMIHLNQYGFFPAASGYDMPVPEFVAKVWCLLNEKLNPSLESFNYDTYRRSTLHQKIDPSALTYKDLGIVADELPDWLYQYVKPHIIASSQAKNRTVYGREEVLKLRDYVNSPKNNLDLFGYGNKN